MSDFKDNMMLSEPAKRALHLLSIRNKNYLKWDWSYTSFDDLVWTVHSWAYLKKHICLICNETLDNVNTDLEVQHGIRHLKEYNLLSFI